MRRRRPPCLIPKPQNKTSNGPFIFSAFLFANHPFLPLTLSLSLSLSLSASASYTTLCNVIFRRRSDGALLGSSIACLELAAVGNDAGLQRLVVGVRPVVANSEHL